MAAAEVQKNLGSIAGLPMPECEAQIRPLIGLKPEQAQAAWVTVLGWVPDGNPPARLVKRAVQQVLKTEQTPEEEGRVLAENQKRHRLRQSIRTGMNELLTMLLGNVERDALIKKVQELQRLLDPILSPRLDNLGLFAVATQTQRTGRRTISDTPSSRSPTRQ